MKKLTSELPLHIRSYIFKLKVDFPVLKNGRCATSSFRNSSLSHNFTSWLWVSCDLARNGKSRHYTTITSATKTYADKAVNAFSDSTGLPHARRSAFESGKNAGNVWTVNPIRVPQRSWQGEFVKLSRASLTGDQFLHSHDRNIWFRDDITGRN